MTARPFSQLAPLATALLLAASALTAQAQTEQTAQPQAQPRTQATHPNQAQTVRLLFAGDVMLDDGPGKVIAEGRDPLAPFDAILKDADYRIANLEVPVATVGKPLESKIFSFRAHPRVMRVLKGRWDALALSNNHAGDYGKAAFVETM